jgi:DNA-binding response OmpR family regulator
MTRRLTALGKDNQSVELTMNPDLLVVKVGRKASRLTMQEYLLLEALAQQPGATLSRTSLLMDVWQCHYPIKTRTVDVHVQRLRRKLGPQLIETVHGIGYRLHTPPCRDALVQAV